MGNTTGMMSGYWQTSRGQGIILAAILIVSAVLLLANLGNQNLWQDEAQTALISKTILTEGVPRGYDGKNYFSQEEGAEYGKNYIWRWHTWLPFYVLAGFYEVFGVSTFVSRLPFVLFGLGIVVLLYYYAKAVWPGTRIPAIAASLLTVSVPFLLLSRQCRYYSMAMFFAALSLYAYVLLMQRRRLAFVLLFAGMTLLFHSQYIYLAALFPALFLHVLIFYRDRLKILTLTIILTMLVNGPWLVWILSGMHYTGSVMMLKRQIMLFNFTKLFLYDLFSYVFPVWILAVVPVIYIVMRVRTGHFFAVNRRFWEAILLPIFFIIFVILVIAMTCPYPFFRYMAPTIPPLIFLAAVIINAAWEAHWFIAVAAVVVLVATSQMKDYLYEITHDYNGPEKGIAKYLNEYGSPDDIVAVTHGDMGLKFYTKMRVVGGSTGEDLSPMKNARWVIIRRHIISGEEKKVGKYLFDNIPVNTYRRITINYPDLAFENRESPREHLFRTDTAEYKVVIYERMN